ncbi:MAG: dipeptidase PepE [Bacteroidota bacterium]|nr:dipeptidase PepE [Odoribacter sp.]MDP3642695.1 dipeptidase PepE [Bacteroidota bacterium]
MKLLLISNSTMPGEAYLDYPKLEIKKFLGENPLTALFIPYAAVTFPFDVYEQKVAERFGELGYQVKSIHHFSDPVQAVREAEVIVVGGGNTWQLVRMLHDNRLMNEIREKVLNGTPYVGWSAGSNVACPTLRTTNDMPIIDPKSFDTTGLVPFQINPHYLDANPEGHGGETREQRIEEFLEINPEIYVVGLREGTMLRIEDQQIRLIGSRTARIFKKGMSPAELCSQDDFGFLL